MGGEKAAPLRALFMSGWLPMGLQVWAWTQVRPLWVVSQESVLVTSALNTFLQRGPRQADPGHAFLMGSAKCRGS